MLLCLACTLASPAALAQDEPERNWHLGIAFGGGQRSNPLISGDDIDINVVVDFSWYGERFFFDNGDLGYTLVERNNFSLNLLGTVSNERSYYSYLTGKQLGLDSIFGQGLLPEGGFGLASVNTDKSGGRNDTVKGPDLSEAELQERNLSTALPDRDYALNGGFELLYISRYGDLQAQVLSDASGVHDGQEAWLSWSKPWFTRNAEYRLTAGLEWQSSALIDYYYGVTLAESFAGRPQYDAGSGINRFVRFSARHALGRHWQAVGMVERNFLSSAISDSPIVSASAIDTFFVGLYYAF